MRSRHVQKPHAKARELRKEGEKAAVEPARVGERHEAVLGVVGELLLRVAPSRGSSKTGGMMGYSITGSGSPKAMSVPVGNALEHLRREDRDVV